MVMRRLLASLPSPALSLGLATRLSRRTLPPRFMRRACPAVKPRDTDSASTSGGEHATGGLRRRSALRRRWREMPFVELARAATWALDARCCVGVARSPVRDGMRFAAGATGPAIDDILLRAPAPCFLAECMAERIFCASMPVDDSESEEADEDEPACADDAGGLFSSTTSLIISRLLDGRSERGGLIVKAGTDCGGEKLLACETLSDRRGVVR